MKISEYAKAVAGAVTAGVAATITAASDGRITVWEALGIVVAAIGGTGIVVFRVPNSDPQTTADTASQNSAPTGTMGSSNTDQPSQ